MKTWQRIKKDQNLIDVFKTRANVLWSVRDFFHKRQFLEVETPLLVPIPSMEPYLEVFETTLLDENRRDKQAFLTTSPEYSMKKLLAAGFPKIFQITKAFRNTEGKSPLHNAEFSLLEWYQTDADYKNLMKDCEDLFFSLCQKNHHTSCLIYQRQRIDFASPWIRLSIADAFRKFANVDPLDLFDGKKMTKILHNKGYTVDPNTTGEQAFHQILLNEVEPKLPQDKPVFLYDYPTSLPSLAKRKHDDTRYVERVELYIAGIEMGNGFSELTDPHEQRERLNNDHGERQRLGKTSFPIDKDFLTALESGIPPCAGMAIGIDRLVMLLRDARSIQEVVFFPTEELFS